MRHPDDQRTVAPEHPARPPGGLAAALRARASELHGHAERSGIVHRILLGQADRYGYALLLRNLLLAYQLLEQGLRRHRHTPGVRMAVRPALFRAPRLAADLAALCGPSWRRSLPLLAEGALYARRVAQAAKGDGRLLIAHAYVRYLGDLNGGQTMKRLLARTLAVEPATLSFYDFPDITDMRAFSAAYRADLDRAGGEIDSIDAVAEEVARAFALNIQVSESVQRSVEWRQSAEPAPPPGPAVSS
jgi:heme oxygenase